MVVVVVKMNTCNHGDVRELIYPGNNSEIPLFPCRTRCLPSAPPSSAILLPGALVTHNTQYTIHNTIAGAAKTNCSQLFNTQVYNLQQQGPHKALLTKSKSGNNITAMLRAQLSVFSRSNPNAFFCLMSTVRVKIYCQ